MSRSLIPAFFVCCAPYAISLAFSARSSARLIGFFFALSTICVTILGVYSSSAGGFGTILITRPDTWNSIRSPLRRPALRRTASGTTRGLLFLRVTVIVCITSRTYVRFQCKGIRDFRQTARVFTLPFLSRYCEQYNKAQCLRLRNRGLDTKRLSIPKD